MVMGNVVDVGHTVLGVEMVEEREAIVGRRLQLFLILLVLIELVLGTALELGQQLVQLLPVLRVLRKLAVLAREDVLCPIVSHMFVLHGLHHVKRTSSKSSNLSAQFSQ